MFKIVAEKKIEYELGGGCKLERFWFRDLIEHSCFTATTAIYQTLPMGSFFEEKENWIRVGRVQARKALIQGLNWTFVF